MTATKVRGLVFLVVLGALIIFSYVSVAHAGLLDPESSGSASEAEVISNSGTSKDTIDATGDKEDPTKTSSTDPCAKDPKCKKYCGTLKYSTIKGGTVTCRKPAGQNGCQIPPGDTLPVCKREDADSIMFNSDPNKTVDYCSYDGSNCQSVVGDPKKYANIVGGLQQGGSWNTDELLPSSNTTGGTEVSGGSTKQFWWQSDSNDLFGIGKGGEFDSSISDSAQAGKPYDGFSGYISDLKNGVVGVGDAFTEPSTPASNFIGKIYEPFSSGKGTFNVFDPNFYGTGGVSGGSSGSLGDFVTKGITVGGITSTVGNYVTGAWQGAKNFASNTWGFVNGSDGNILAADPIISSPIVGGQQTVDANYGGLPDSVQQALSDVGAEHKTPSSSGGLLAGTQSYLSEKWEQAKDAWNNWTGTNKAVAGDLLGGTKTGFEGSPEVGPKAAQIIHEDALVLHGGIDQLDDSGNPVKGNAITVGNAKDFFGKGGEGTKLTNYIGDRTIDTVVENKKGEKEEKSFSADGAYYTRDGDEIKPNKMGGVTVREAVGSCTDGKCTTAGTVANVYGPNVENKTLGEAIAAVEPASQAAKAMIGEDSRKIFQKWYDYAVSGGNEGNPGDVQAFRGALTDFYASGYTSDDAKRLRNNPEAMSHYVNDVYNNLAASGRLAKVFTGPDGRVEFTTRIMAQMVRETGQPTAAKNYIGGQGIMQTTGGFKKDLLGYKTSSVSPISDSQNDAFNVGVGAIGYNKLASKYENLDKATSAYYSGSPTPKNTKYHTAAQIQNYINGVNEYQNGLKKYLATGDASALKFSNRCGSSSCQQEWAGILTESKKYVGAESFTSEEVASVNMVGETLEQRAARIADAAAKSVTAGVEKVAQTIFTAGKTALTGVLQQLGGKLGSGGKSGSGGSGGNSGGSGDNAGTGKGKDTPVIQRPVVSCNPDTINNGNQEKVTLRWTCYGDTTSAYGINFNISGDAEKQNSGPATGSLEFTPAATSSGWITYGVGCKPAKTERTCLVRVLHPNVTLSADVSEVALGARANLAWSAYDVERCAVYDPAGIRVAVGTEAGKALTKPIEQASEFGVVCRTKTGFVTAVATTTVTVGNDERAVLPVSVPSEPDFTSAE